MLYCHQQKGMTDMDRQVTDLHKLPNIEKFENLHLQTLSENCSALEEQVYKIAQELPGKQRQIIEAYISIRDDLEVETVRAALRWGKQHYK